MERDRPPPRPTTHGPTRAGDEQDGQVSARAHPPLFIPDLNICFFA